MGLGDEKKARTHITLVIGLQKNQESIMRYTIIFHFNKMKNMIRIELMALNV